MFLLQSLSPRNPFWKYIVGSVIVIAASAIGQTPLIGAIMLKSATTGEPFPVTNLGLMTFLDSNLTLFLLMLSFAVGLVALFLVFRFLHSQSIRSVTTGRPKIDWKRVFFAFFLWASVVIVVTVIDYQMAPEDYLWNFEPERFAILAIVGIIMIPIQTSTEEYIFRGYLMQGFANLARNRWFPLLMTSLIFGLMHIANPEVDKIGYVIMLYYIGTGLFLGVITLLDDGMELALGFHAANNLVGALLITTEWTAFQTDSILKDVSEPAIGTDVLIPVFIIFPILFFIFKWKYNWTDIREKLTGKLPETETNAPII